MWVQNTWGFRNPGNFIIPPGIVNYKYNSTTDINMFFSFQNLQENLLIKEGTPMVNIVPMDDRRVKVHVHKLSDGTTKNLINKYESKCPFGFGK
jgi:hypothetical protein